MPTNDSRSYERDALGGYLSHNDTTDAYYTCPVNFAVPDGSAYFIKSIGMRFYDDLTDGQLEIKLLRRNLYTGVIHTVAEWWSSFEGSSPIAQTASQGTETGYKLVDTKKFSYWLSVQFFKNGTVNPFPNLALIQVRVHYGT